MTQVGIFFTMVSAALSELSTQAASILSGDFGDTSHVLPFCQQFFLHARSVHVPPRMHQPCTAPPPGVRKSRHHIVTMTHARPRTAWSREAPSRRSRRSVAFTTRTERRNLRAISST